MTSRRKSWKKSKRTGRAADFFRRLALYGILLAAVESTATQLGIRMAHASRLPPQGQQIAQIEVDGCTSRLSGRIDIAKVAEPSPDGLSCGDFVSRLSAGYVWFCSQHWALKTDLPDSQAADLLLLLELAWPQYAAIFDAVPSCADSKRLALVIGSSRNSLKRAMIDDGMFAFTLGGVMQEGYGAAYLYAGVPYQTRYILLHEATHLYQYCLSGDTRGAYGFFVEGVADYFSSHVYDPGTKSLTVNVLDRAPIHNHLADGLREWRERGKPAFSALYAEENPSRPISVLLTAFLQHNADFGDKWRRFCRRMLFKDHGTPAKQHSDALLDELYGGTDGLDAPFAEWMNSLSQSFNLVERDFDQEGNAFVSGEPASPEAPAVLEGRTCDCRQLTIRWRAPVEKGSFAKIELLDSGGMPSSNHVISNAAYSASAAYLVDGVATGRGGRRLGESLRRGEALEIELGAKASNLIWRISASQPGVEFGFVCDPSAKRTSTGRTARRSRIHERLAPPVARDLEPIVTWKALGPFQLPGGKFEAPRRSLNRECDDSVAVLDDGTFAAWRMAAMNRNSPFCQVPIANITRTFGRQANNSYALLSSEIECKEDCKRELVLGVSDGIEIYINGELTYSDIRQREWQDGNTRLEISLRKGRNEILVRLVHGKGVWLLSGGLKPPSRLGD